VSLWLNSGVPATEVARRAGHGVAVLLKIYAHCIDGQADAANQRITDALGTQDAGKSLVTRETTTASRYPGVCQIWKTLTPVRPGPKVFH